MKDIVRQVHAKLAMRDLIEMSPPVTQWPNAIRLPFFRKRLDNVGRFKVTIFFLINGVPPDTITRVYETNFDFDKDAWRQLEFIFKNIWTKNWSAWSCEERKSVTANTARKFYEAKEYGTVYIGRWNKTKLY